MDNHWWQVPLYVTARGLGTSAMPCAGKVLDIEFDFLDHVLTLRASDGATRVLPLVPRTVADFCTEYMAALQALGCPVKILPVPVEMATAIPFAEDREHSSYDPDAAHRCWQILARTDAVLKRFRSRFVGKASPVHFFWGSFDLAMTRFSGRRAPRHPGGVPNCPDYVMEEAYSHECSSCGFWPGGNAVQEPSFYAYAYPEPPGYAGRPVRPEAARYSTEMREFLLPYEAVRSASSPEDTLLEFFQSTYEAAADLGGWDRTSLDRDPGLRR